MGFKVVVAIFRKGARWQRSQVSRQKEIFDGCLKRLREDVKVLFNLRRPPMLSTDHEVRKSGGITTSRKEQPKCKIIDVRYSFLECGSPSQVMQIAMSYVLYKGDYPAGFASTLSIMFPDSQ
jgi:hypothetical protein